MLRSSVSLKVPLQMLAGSLLLDLSSLMGLRKIIGFFFPPQLFLVLSLGTTTSKLFLYLNSNWNPLPPHTQFCLKFPF